MKYILNIVGLILALTVCALRLIIGYILCALWDLHYNPRWYWIDDSKYSYFTSDKHWRFADELKAESKELFWVFKNFFSKFGYILYKTDGKYHLKRDEK